MPRKTHGASKHSMEVELYNSRRKLTDNEEEKVDRFYSDFNGSIIQLCSSCPSDIRGILRGVSKDEGRSISETVWILFEREYDLRKQRLREEEEEERPMKRRIMREEEEYDDRKLLDDLSDLAGLSRFGKEIITYKTSGVLRYCALAV